MEGGILKWQLKNAQQKEKRLKKLLAAKNANQLVTE